MPGPLLAGPLRSLLPFRGETWWTLRLLPALLVYAVLAATTVRGVGIVGEVAASWGLAEAPTVLTSLDPPAAVAPAAWGPLVARQSRPTESLALGPVELPLAVNAYTGGPPDWPARLATAAGRAAGVAAPYRWGEAMHLALGAVFVFLAHRFLRFHGTPAAADGVALLLVTDWTFVFYRKVLGGTEILLHAAGLLVLWALWSRRWRGGTHGTVAIAVGAGLGLLAKATFAATLGAFAVAALVMRWDRAALLPPAPVRRWLLLVLPALCLSPLLLAYAHHAALPADAVVPSHDTVGLQIARWSAATPAREGAQNLLAFLGNPLSWFAWALKASEVPLGSPLRALGFVVTVAGIVLEWRARTPTASAALLRFLSIAAPLQLLFLYAANHDLHHLAQATPSLLLLCALAADRVCALALPRSVLRGFVTILLLSPHLVAGVLHLRATDRVLASMPRSTFTEAGQAALVELVRRAGADRVVTTDYEVYGMAELRAPEVTWVHAWGAVARGERDPARLLTLARGGWYLVLRPTAPMVYNWRPDLRTLREAAGPLGLDVQVVERLSDARGDWATLYRVEDLP